MIKVNDRFEFKRADYCWELTEWKDGVNPKTKEPTRTSAKSWHANLTQLCKAILDRTAGDCSSIQELKEHISYVESQLQSAIARSKP